MRAHLGQSIPRVEPSRASSQAAALSRRVWDVGTNGYPIDRGPRTERGVPRRTGEVFEHTRLGRALVQHAELSAESWTAHLLGRPTQRSGKTRLEPDDDLTVPELRSRSRAIRIAESTPAPSGVCTSCAPYNRALSRGEASAMRASRRLTCPTTRPWLSTTGSLRNDPVRDRCTMS